MQKLEQMAGESPNVRSTPVKFSEEDIKIATDTARAAGAVGKSAVLPRLLRGEAFADLSPITVDPNSSVLNFGSGPAEAHTKLLQQEGFTNVTSVDHGLNPEALNKTYDTVFASNVINVQGSEEALDATLSQLFKASKAKGQVIINFPASPRKGAYK